MLVLPKLNSETVEIVRELKILWVTARVWVARRTLINNPHAVTIVLFIVRPWSNIWFVHQTLDWVHVKTTNGSQ